MFEIAIVAALVLGIAGETRNPCMPGWRRLPSLPPVPNMLKDSSVLTPLMQRRFPLISLCRLQSRGGRAAPRVGWPKTPLFAVSCRDKAVCRSEEPLTTHARSPVQDLTGQVQRFADGLTDKGAWGMVQFGCVRRHGAASDPLHWQRELTLVLIPAQTQASLSTPRDGGGAGHAAHALRGVRTRQEKRPGQGHCGARLPGWSDCCLSNAGRCLVFRRGSWLCRSLASPPHRLASSLDGAEAVGAACPSSAAGRSAKADFSSTLACCARPPRGVQNSHLISSKVSKYTEKISNWKAINRALSKGSFRVITLLRVSPLFPFSISNYIYGLTQIKFGDYVAGSLIGMLPGTLWYVTVGKFGRSVLEADTGGNTLLQGLGLGLALLVSLGSASYITKLIKEARAPSGRIHVASERPRGKAPSPEPQLRSCAPFAGG